VRMEPALIAARHGAERATLAFDRPKHRRAA
jgi:hypothetical protein